MGITTWQRNKIKLQQKCTWLSLIHGEYLQNWLIFLNMIFPPQKCQNINTQNFFSEWPNFSETTYGREPIRGISQFSFQFIVS